MSENGHQALLFALDAEIQSELIAMQDTLDWLPKEGELDNERYAGFARRITHIDGLFNKADMVMRGMSFDQSQPHLISLLETKDRLQLSRDRFHFLSHEFHVRYSKDDLTLEEERERVLERTEEQPQEEIPEELPEEEPEVPTEDPDALMEESLAAEAEEAMEEEKAKKKKAEAKRTAERRRREQHQMEDQNRADAASAAYSRQISDDARRREEMLQAEQRLRDEMLRQDQLRQDSARQFYGSQDDGYRYDYDASVKRHLDFSSLEGDMGSRHDGRTDFKYYSYTPDGTVEMVYDRNPSMSNNQVIASTIGSSMSRPVSSAYEDTMRFNMQMARLNYESKIGTPEALDALRDYMHERNSYVTFRDNLRSGATEMYDAPIVAPQPVYQQQNRQNYFADARPVQYQYTPQGLVGSNVEQGQLSGSQSTYRTSYTPPPTPAQRAAQYTTENPLRVTPEYEQVLTDRMNHSVQVMHQALRVSGALGGAASIPRDTAQEIRTALNAYSNFQSAKQAGTVVVTPEAKQQSIDFSMWQSQRPQITPQTTVPSPAANRSAATLASLGAGSGRFRVTTAPISSADIRSGPNGMSGSDWLQSIRIQTQNKGNNWDGPATPGSSGYSAHSGKKEQTKEVASDVLHHKSKLRTESVAWAYTKEMGGIAAGYTQQGLSRAGGKAYRMIEQYDESGTLKGISKTQYYATTAIGVAHALSHSKVVNSTNTINRGHLLERGYGEMGQMSRKELHREIQRVREQCSVLKEEIRVLKEKGAAATAGEAMDLARKTKEKLALDQESRKLHSLRELRYNNSTAAAVDKAIEKEANGGPVRMKHINEAMKKYEEQYAKEMSKKFGKMNDITPKSLKKEIQAATQEARELKHRLKPLQEKLKRGETLTSVERHKMALWGNRKAKLDEDLRKMHGLQKARKKHSDMQKAYKKRGQDTGARKGGLNGTLNALQNFILKPLDQGDQIGAMGIAKAFRFSTNHYVHEFVKRTVMYSYYTVRWGARVTHLDRVAHKVTQKVVVKPAKAVKKVAVKTAKTAANATTAAIKRWTPQPVKTAVKTGQKALRYVSARYFHMTGAIRRVVDKAKDAVAKSFIGKAYAWANKVLSGAMNALRTAMAFLKGLIIKALMIMFGFIATVVLIVTVVTALGGAATTVMLVPGASEDGKFDLSPYNAILVREWAEYEQELLDMGDAEGYYRTTVEIADEVPNVREILSMTSVRMCQELDLESNPRIEPYMSQLMRDLNPYEREEGTCYCDTYDCSVRYETYSYSYPDAEGNIISGSYTIAIPYCPGDHPTLTLKLHSLHFDAAFSADSMGAAEAGAAVGIGDCIGHFTITYYCTEKYEHICNAGPPYQTATGTTPTPGRTIAVDPSVIPLNTRVIINGQEYVAEDTGGAINGNRIDIAVTTHAEAIRKGTQSMVPVYNISYDASDMLESGTWNGWTDGNMEWAKNICYQDWSELYSGIPNVTDVVGNDTDLSGVEFIDGERPGYPAITNLAQDQLGNAGGAKFWRWWGFDYRVPWCAIFVSWCADQTGNLGTAIPKFALVEDGISWFQSRGQWAARGDTTPVAGDLIFFDWGGDGDPDHVGLVVGTDGTNVYTVEGNSGDRVRTKSYALNSSVIFGYGLPNY